MRAVIRQFPIAMGIDEGTDPKMRPPGTLHSLVNGVWRKQGRVDKRYGTAGYTKNIVGGGTLSAAARLFTRGAELCVIDGSKVYSYTAAGWKLAAGLGQISEVGLTWDTLSDSYDGVLASDVGLTSDGLLVHAWVTGDPAVGAPELGTLFYQVIDLTNGSRSTAATYVGPVASTRQVRVLTSGANWMLVFNENTSVRFSLAGATPVTLRADGAFAALAFDACIIGSEFVIAYNLAANGIGLYRYSIAATPVQQAAGTVTGEAAASIPAISIDGNAGDLLWIGYQAGSDKFRVATANPTTLAQVLAPTDIETVTNCFDTTVAIKRLTATTCAYAYASQNAFVGGTYIDGVVVTTVVTSAGATSATRKTHGMNILSRPFFIGTTLYMLVAAFLKANGLNLPNHVPGGDSYLVEVGTTTQATALPHRLVGHIDVLTGGNWRGGAHANAVAVSSTDVRCVIPFMATAPGSLFRGWRQGCRLVTMTVGASRPADMWRSTEVGSETYISAGVLTAWDGRQAFDYGFAGPAMIESGSSVDATGFIVQGTYLYQLVPEYRSNAGVLHRGPTSPGQTFEVTTPLGRVRLRYIPVHLSQKQPDLAVAANESFPVMVRILRSVINGSLPQSLTVEPTYNVSLQSPTGSPQLFDDTRPDSNIDGSATITLAKRPAIYTAGGELDDYQPPACTTHTLHRNRLFIVAGDKRTVWFSKDHSSNIGTAPGFHPSLTMAFPEDVVGIIGMDEKLVAFSATKPYYVLGDGPAPNGHQSDYTAPNPIQADVGLSNPRSLVGTPDGVMFLSSRGFFLLTRGLELVYVGQPVEDTLAAYPNVTSAVLVPTQNQVRWTCNNASGTAGRTIVFDYATRQWAVFKHWDADGAVDGTPIADAVLWNGVWSFVTPSGKVYREDTTTHLDNGNTWVKQSGELAWLAEGGPLGYQHIRRAFLLGDKYTDCNFTLKFGFNHAAAYAQSYTWASDKLTQFGDGINVGMRVGSQNGASPRCRAFRVAWEDAAPTGPGTVTGIGQGFNLSAIGIEFIPKPDMDRRSARART